MAKQKDQDPRDGTTQAHAPTQKCHEVVQGIEVKISYMLTLTNERPRHKREEGDWRVE